MVNTVKHVALNNISSPLQGLFFLEEALGISPVEYSTHCKVRMTMCRICNSEKALLTTEEEEEYNILKENVTLNKVTGQLQANYSFMKDPGELIDIGKEVKACQTSQKRFLLKHKKGFSSPQGV